MKEHDLTQDRPLPTREAKKLVSWWENNGWYCTKELAYKRRGKKFWYIKASKNG